MTHEDLEALIDLLNNEKERSRARDRIFVSTLTNEVDFARVWSNDPRGGIVNEGSDSYYFIKDDAQTYVAAIFDMHIDLHAYTKKAYRRRGYITAALDKVIFPKLWQENRRTQEITFKEIESGERLARRLGFRITGIGRAEKDLSVYASASRVIAQRRPLSRNEVDAMRIDIDRAKLYLKMVSERLELAYGDIRKGEFVLEHLIHEEVGGLFERTLDFMDARHREFGFKLTRMP